MMPRFGHLINIKVTIAVSGNLYDRNFLEGCCPMSLPPMLKRIRLDLARSKEFPRGSANHGYEFVAPLDSKGHIDPHLWHQYRDLCDVRMFWRGEDEEIGRLTQ
jgi:hypothetical protein